MLPAELPKTKGSKDVIQVQIDWSSLHLIELSHAIYELSVVGEVVISIYGDVYDLAFFGRACEL